MRKCYQIFCRIIGSLSALLGTWCAAGICSDYRDEWRGWALGVTLLLLCWGMAVALFTENGGDEFQ